MQFGTPTICGSTGWLDKLDEINADCKKNEGAFIYASNFSVGVNIFLSAVWTSKFDSYICFRKILFCKLICIINVDLQHYGMATLQSDFFDRFSHFPVSDQGDVHVN